MATFCYALVEGGSARSSAARRRLRRWPRPCWWTSLEPLGSGGSKGWPWWWVESRPGFRSSGLGCAKAMSYLGSRVNGFEVESATEMSFYMYRAAGLMRL